MGPPATRPVRGPICKTHRAMKRTIATIALILLGALAGTGSAATKPKKPALPRTLKTPTGNFVTLYSFSLPSGKTTVANFDVGICTSAHTPKGTFAYPEFFTLSVSAGSPVHLAPTAARSPALKIQPMGPKQCVRGWISFDVPKGVHATALDYTALGPAIVWKLG